MERTVDFFFKWGNSTEGVTRVFAERVGQEDQPVSG